MFSDVKMTHLPSHHASHRVYCSDIGSVAKVVCGGDPPPPVIIVGHRLVVVAPKRGKEVALLSPPPKLCSIYICTE